MSPVPARDLALDHGRSMVAAEVRALGLPQPVFRLVQLDQPRALGPALVDRVLRAEVHGSRRFELFLPLAGSSVLPAELVVRLPLAAPASALYTRRGWSLHPIQGEDSPAQALLDALSQLHGMGSELQWTRRLPQGTLSLDWTIQLVADAADACQVVVRTAPLGPVEDLVGIASFLAKVDAIGGLLGSWTGDMDLPVGVIEPCLALDELPGGVEVGAPEPQAFRTAIPAEDTEEAVHPAAVVDPERADQTAADVLEEQGTPAPLAAPPAPGEISGPRASPALAALASLFIPGLGQILCGQTTKGGVLLIVSLCTCGMFGLLNLVLAVDAWKVAATLRRGEAVGRWSFFG